MDSTIIFVVLFATVCNIIDSINIDPNDTTNVQLSNTTTYTQNEYLWKSFQLMIAKIIFSI